MFNIRKSSQSVQSVTTIRPAENFIGMDEGVIITVTSNIALGTFYCLLASLDSERHECCLARDLLEMDWTMLSQKTHFLFSAVFMNRYNTPDDHTTPRALKVIPDDV